MKYKVGDRVKLVNVLFDHNEPGAETDEMIEYEGAVVTIAEVYEQSYGIYEDEGTYLWTDDDIEGLAADIERSDGYAIDDVATDAVTGTATHDYSFVFKTFIIARRDVNGRPGKGNKSG